ncbi:OLC1v1017926C5 [Oldenlandia corymbosa var. corymbosa]|uniref:Protein phosphatase n=1 Tax=Oldenlandia corymbosa var. corymbosa TaxID=529605 RepID=A0AAV1EAU0_OLDCO|nr:OLC1v1017926C5 [Oldenlandia corymbosa var. corymbosa]
MLSKYVSRLVNACRQGSQRSTFSQVVLQELVEIPISQTKLLFGGASEVITDLQGLVRPGTVAAAQANLHVANRRKNISLAEVFSRAISVPSVSGPSFQVCGYHVDRLLSELTEVSVPHVPQSMAVCSSRLGFSYGSRTSKHIQPSIVAKNSLPSSSSRSIENCRNASMSSRNKEQPNKFLVYGYYIYNVAKRKGNSPFHEFGLRVFHTSSPSCSSAGTAPDVSFDSSIREENLSSSANSSTETIPMHRALKLNSGSCYLPHPDKEETGGEDAHFICLDQQAIGVADGVGGWADLGIDAGQYARELMSNSVTAIQDEPKGSVDPARVLEKAYVSTKAKGSSTACIVALTDQGLHAVNLGDSGFMVVRDGCTVFRSPVQQHDFNFTYQLESGNAGDLPSSGQVFTIPVAPGDVIVAGTDGLFDNLYNNDITAVVVHAVRAGFGPQVTAQKIAALARQRAQDKNRQTPFSAAAQDAGFRYYGGKLDDITVVVSYITSDNNVCIDYLYTSCTIEKSWTSPNHTCMSW